YNEHCATCHGNDGRVTSVFPDLRYAGALHGAEAFKAIVIDGVLTQNGMVSFRDALTPGDAEAIRAYVVKLANDAKNNPQPAGGPLGAPSPPPASPATPAPSEAPHR